MNANSALVQSQIAADAALYKRVTESAAGAKETFSEKEIMNRMSFAEHADMYWKFFFGKNETTPSTALPRMEVDVSRLYADAKALKACWLGHSSLLLNIDGYTILTDPVFQKKVSPVGPTSFHKKLPLSIDQLPHVDAVIISHDHYDHLNKYSVQKLAMKTDVFVVPLGVGRRLVKWGVSQSKITELGWWENFSVEEKLVISATPAQHFSGRSLFDRNKTLWASWVIKTPHHNVFFSGDSGYFHGFKEIGQKYGPFDVTYLECGAYNKRWPKIHMFPEETVKACLDLGATYLQPIHWATFNLSMHSWYEPIERLISAAWNHDVRLSIPQIGEVVDYQGAVPSKLWWELSKSGKQKAGARPELAAEVQ